MDSTPCCRVAPETDEEDRGSEDNDLCPSRLGTKEYWDEVYERDLETFRDTGDVGEIWYGEEITSVILRWMDLAQVPEHASILDIGTGNGALVVELAKRGYTNILGVDYSQASVELAASLLQNEGITLGGGVTVSQKDFLSCSGELKGFDVCIDKGTFDAVSLNPDERAKGRYLRALRDSLKEGGFFIIASCNWTREQLLRRFSVSEGFELVQEFSTPCFSFAGQTGSSVTALTFRRLH